MVMNMNWTRNNREVWYLVGIVLTSLALAPPFWVLQGSFTLLEALSTVLSTFILRLLSPGFLLLVYLIPVLPHLPAFLYGVYFRTDGDAGSLPGQKENYISALYISAPTSFFVTYNTYIFSGIPPTYPIWQFEVAIVAANLLILTFHAYFVYEKYGDLRTVVLLIMIYAPWAQFARLFTGQGQFM